ncbi:MAG TPA: toll/interleukin-1 receptor domain-containing protein [Kofleriaceae bacterium]
MLQLDVFLSASSKDREFAQRLAKDLVAAGLRVWNQWDTTVGDSFAGAIEKGIRASRFMLIVMSPDYFQSAWTQQEWQYGLAEEVKVDRIRLVPILYRDCEIPPMLRTKQWADFRDGDQYRLALAHLIRDLRSLSGAEPAAQPATEAPRSGEHVEQMDALHMR